jgi:hypothetical protein
MTDEAMERRLDEKQMHESYRERERAFCTAASKLWDEEAQLRARIRENTNLTGDERLDAYKEGFEGLSQRFGALVEGFSRDVSARVVAAEKTLFADKNELFSQALMLAANTPDDRLESALNAARRSGLEDLQAALAQTAYERSPSRRPKIFQAWAESNPERAEALETIGRTPGPVQLHDRSERAMRPPKASPSDLEPTPADQRERAEEQAKAKAGREAFFGGASKMLPQRRVGRRVS